MLSYNFNNNLSNYDRFPNNVFKPVTVANGSKLFLVRFNNLYELYDFLKSEPQINDKIFSDLSSLDGSYDFAGVPYNEAVENLIKENKDANYQEFLRIHKGLDNCINIPIHKYKTVPTLAGGHLNIPAYSAGNPLCYETEERIMTPKFVKANVLLSYRCGTTKEQVFNRAIIIIILKALEKAGYNIDLNTFSLARCNDEYIHVVVKIKNYSEKLNIDSLYKTLCQVEFLRRIIFRLREITPVTDYEWAGGYGSTCGIGEVKQVLNCPDNEIFFGQPSDVGVNGYSLEDDFARMISCVGLDDKINVREAKERFSMQVKKLIKR